MFKRLRYRLLIMNLSIISVLMLISFSIIYAMTYNNIQTSIDRDLYRINDFGKTDSNLSPKINDSINNMQEPDRKIENDEFMPERTVFFSITTDVSNQILTIESFFETEDSFFEDALNAVVENDNLTGHFSLDGNEWAYLVTQRPGGNFYAFIDMTAQQNVLDRLVYTFLIVSAMMLLAIFFISNFLTNRSVAPIKDAFEKQKLFISDASHELKTPLAVIRTNVDVLLSNHTTQEDTKWLTYIKSEVERMSRLTNDLLYLTQMEDANPAILFNTSVLLNDRIESLLLGMDALAFEKEIHLDYEMDAGITVYGNAEQLTQVVMILLDNALKYTPKQGEIRLSLKRTNHHVKLTVSNTGDGISPEDIDHIFDRFYRVDKARSRSEGSYGLGLSIAKAIVEQHQGKISCESVPHVETTFSVKLPIRN